MLHRQKMREMAETRPKPEITVSRGGGFYSKNKKACPPAGVCGTFSKTSVNQPDLHIKLQAIQG